MIRYTPPKSQIWGHAVGRLQATSVVARSLEFLNAECEVLGSQPATLFVGWKLAEHAIATIVAAEIEATLGRPTAEQDVPCPGGPAFRQCRWSFPVKNLPDVAAWFDRLSDDIKTQDVVAQSTMSWAFAWRDEPLPLLPLQSAGGMFGIHLGKPHRITTMFTFRDLERFKHIQTRLADLDLAKLSEKHLRPKPKLGLAK